MVELHKKEFYKSLLINTCLVFFIILLLMANVSCMYGFIYPDIPVMYPVDDPGEGIEEGQMEVEQPQVVPGQGDEQVSEQTPVEEEIPSFDTQGGLFSEAEEYFVDQEKEEWVYKSRDFSVFVKHFVDTNRVLSYYVADIYQRGENQVYCGFPSGNADPFDSGDRKTYGNLKTDFTFSIARKHDAILAINGDYILSEPNFKGIQMRNSVVYADKNKGDSITFSEEGEMLLFKAGQFQTDDILNMGITDVYSFGPTLIEDSQLNEKELKSHRLKPKNPRCGIGMVDKGHLVAIVVEGRIKNYSNGMTLMEFAELFAQNGCTMAYNLDGGLSTSMVFMGAMLNHPSPNVREKSYLTRKVPDAVLFGKSQSVRDFYENYEDTYPNIRVWYPESQR